MDDATTLPATAAQSAYGTVAIVLHWSLAVLIVAAFFIGLTMVDLPFSPRRFRLFNWHKWIGIAVLLLSAARLLWRATGHRPPPAPAGCPRGSSPRFAPRTWSSTDSSSRSAARLGVYLGGRRARSCSSAGCRCPTSSRATSRSATRS
jgi:hypothetical protein